ncbi:restriction endonuclease subunit S [Neptunomonas concharum]|uniref:Restriction endonuclease n=1 Tax=Neptunomonas concharum TaxID=1031538 RepID=A0A5P1RF40_9GAMM|nr:restriction endonuclease subunit S [Neptunomonas concharum]QEQ98227.1 restriction endonuclease [Neptunomonas concharum]
MEKQFPANWTKATIGDLANYVNGRAFKPTEWKTNGKPIIRIQNLNKPDAVYNFSDQSHEDKYSVKKGDLLFAWSASLGAHIWKGDDAWLNQHIFNVMPKSGVDKNYIYYLLSKITAELYAKAHGSGMVHVTKGKFEETEVLLSPTNEQKRIVAKIEELFSELDNGIAALKTAREQLKVYRQAVLKHAFEGKLTEQWREDNCVDKTSWQAITIKDISLLGPSNGRSVKDKAGGFPVLRLTALKNGKLDLNEFKEGAWNKDEAQNYIVKEGDFLFSRGNGSKHLVGRGGLVTGPIIEVAFPDTMMRIRLDKTKVIPSFFSYLWESRLIRNQIESSARTTAGIYKINQQHVKSFILSLPSLVEQKTTTDIIDKKLSVVDAQLYALEQQLMKAETLRQSILKKAFSGQLVPQDPNDEPASELLARIQAEKAASDVKAKKAPAKRGRKAKEASE